MRLARVWIAALVMVLALTGSADAKKQEIKLKATVHSATLTWTATTSGNASTNIYRAPCPTVTGTTTGTNGSITGTCAAPGTFVLIGNAPSGTLTFTDSTLAPSTSYSYQLSSLCPAAGCTDLSVGESIKAPVPALGAKTAADPLPLPPTNITITVK